MLLVRITSMSAFCFCLCRDALRPHCHVALEIYLDLGWWVMGQPLRMAATSKGAINLNENNAERKRCPSLSALTLLLRLRAHPNCPHQPWCREQCTSFLFVCTPHTSTDVHLRVSRCEYPHFHPVSGYVLHLSALLAPSQAPPSSAIYQLLHASCP
jgi:hypothetical protein